MLANRKTKPQQETMGTHHDAGNKGLVAAATADVADGTRLKESSMLRGDENPVLEILS